MASKTTTERQTETTNAAELGRQLHNLVIKACRAITKANMASGRKDFEFEGKTVRLNWGLNKQDSNCYTIYITLVGERSLDRKAHNSLVKDLTHLYTSPKPEGLAIWLTRHRDVVQELADMELSK